MPIKDISFICISSFPTKAIQARTGCVYVMFDGLPIRQSSRDSCVFGLFFTSSSLKQSNKSQEIIYSQVHIFVRSYSSYPIHPISSAKHEGRCPCISFRKDGKRRKVSYMQRKSGNYVVFEEACSCLERGRSFK